MLHWGPLSSETPNSWQAAADSDVNAVDADGLPLVYSVERELPAFHGPGTLCRLLPCLVFDSFLV